MTRRPLRNVEASIRQRLLDAGFPSPALVESLAVVARRRPETLFRH